MKINDMTVLEFAEGVKCREESFGLLIISKTTPALSLNEDGKVVYELINGQNSVGNIIEEIKNKFDGDIEDKVYQLLQSFVDLQICKCIEEE